jgi:hypothetical protein
MATWRSGDERRAARNTAPTRQARTAKHRSSHRTACGGRQLGGHHGDRIFQGVQIDREERYRQPGRPGGRGDILATGAPVAVLDAAQLALPNPRRARKARSAKDRQARARPGSAARHRPRPARARSRPSMRSVERDVLPDHPPVLCEHRRIVGRIADECHRGGPMAQPAGCRATSGRARRERDRTVARRGVPASSRPIPDRARHRRVSSAFVGRGAVIVAGARSRAAARRPADDVAEHALARGGVLVGVHPAESLVVGDQPPGEAVVSRLVRACALRATPPETRSSSGE